jgi:hypothetical protein
MRRSWDFGLLSVFLVVSFLSGVFGYVLGWDHACTKEQATALGIDRERSTASAGPAIVFRETVWRRERAADSTACDRDDQWRDGLTVACGRVAR